MSLLTIITIVRNDVNGLKSTHNSLISKPDYVDWVVIDGASTDGTKEYIANNSGFIDSWVSEKDSGIADAFNKGILNSKGKYVLFLNAGDCLKPHFFLLADKLIKELEIRQFSIGVARVDFGGRVIGRYVTGTMQVKRNHLPHQGMLIKRTLFSEVGLYDINYRLGMDYEWSLRLLPRWHSTFHFSNEVLVFMDDVGVSISSYPKTFMAYHRARMKHAIVSDNLSLIYSIYFISRRWLSLKVNFFKSIF